MGEEGGKLTGIGHIVRLKGMLQKWHSTALGGAKDDCDHPAAAAATTKEDGGGSSSDHNHHPEELPLSSSTAPSGGGGIPPVVAKRLKSAISIACDSDEESCQSPEPPPDVPKGYLAVYVGPEHRRFVIPTSYLYQPVFKVLLEKAEEEFGFDHKGALTFPCEIETFKYILQCMDRHQRGLIDDEGNPTDVQE